MTQIKTFQVVQIVIAWSSFSRKSENHASTFSFWGTAPLKQQTPKPTTAKNTTTTKGMLATRKPRSATMARQASASGDPR
jgi:hypothetical protein